MNYESIYAGLPDDVRTWLDKGLLQAGLGIEDEGGKSALFLATLAAENPAVMATVTAGHHDLDTPAAREAVAGILGVSPRALEAEMRRFLQTPEIGKEAAKAALQAGARAGALGRAAAASPLAGQLRKAAIPAAVVVVMAVGGYVAWGWWDGRPRAIPYTVMPETDIPTEAPKNGFTGELEFTNVDRAAPPSPFQQKGTPKIPVITAEGQLIQLSGRVVKLGGVRLRPLACTAEDRETVRQAGSADLCMVAASWRRIDRELRANPRPAQRVIQCEKGPFETVDCVVYDKMPGGEFHVWDLAEGLVAARFADALESLPRKPLPTAAAFKEPAAVPKVFYPAAEPPKEVPPAVAPPAEPPKVEPPAPKAPPPPAPAQVAPASDLPAGIMPGSPEEAAYRSSQANARASAGVRAPTAPPPVMPALPALAGRAKVVDTGNITVEGMPAKLAGVEGLGGEYARQLGLFIENEAGGMVTCHLVGAAYSCKTLQGVDLAEAAVMNGAAKAAKGASARLRELETDARANRRGVWASQ